LGITLKPEGPPALSIPWLATRLISR